MKTKIFLCFLLLLASKKTISQCITFSGPMETCAGMEISYFATFDLSCCAISACEAEGIEWIVQGGEKVRTIFDFSATQGVVVVWDQNSSEKRIWANHSMMPGGVTLVIDGVMTSPLPNKPTQLLTNVSSLCPGNSVNLTTDVTAHSEMYFLWEYSTNNGGSWNGLNTTTTTSSNNTHSLPSSNDTKFNLKFRVTGVTNTSYCYAESMPVESAPVTAYHKPPDVTVTPFDKRCTNTASSGAHVTVNSPNTSSYSNIVVNFSGDEKDPLAKSSANNYFYQLGTGSYTARVYDTNASNDRSPCYAETSFTIVTINPTVSVTINSVTHETCYNPSAGTGSISATASGTNTASPYSFVWNNGGGSGSSISNLHGDVTYTATVTDANGCTGTASQFVDEPAIITPGGSVTKSINCNGQKGEITVTATGGSGAFHYSIDNGASYSASALFQNLSPSPTSYVVKVRDANATTCIVSGPTVPLAEPAVISVGATAIIHPTCSGSSTGNFTVNATGGTGIITYTVPGYGTRNVGSEITGIASGTYTVSLADANSCPASTSVTVNQPVSASYIPTSASCSTVADGSITVTSVSGGTGSYTYYLDNALKPSNVFTGVATGSSYQIKVKDGNNCDFIISNAAVGLRPAIIPSISQTAVLACYNDATAALDLTPGTGWTEPYTYSWKKNNAATGIITQDISNQGAGDYEVTITDAKTCSITATKTINQPTEVSGVFNIPTTNGYAVACKGGSLGSINLTPQGGTGPGYSFLWYKNDVSLGVTTEDLSSLGAGNYKVKITDANNCTVTTANQVLNEPLNAVSVSLNSKADINCFGESTGAIHLTGTSGFGSLQYKLDGAIFDAGYQVSSSFIGLPADDYIVTAKDGNGCEMPSSTISLTTPSSAVGISGISRTNPLCNGASTGTLTVTPQGGTAPYTYRLNGSATVLSSSSIENLAAGDYVVRVVDSKNCFINSATQTLTNPSAISFGTVNVTPQSCAAIVDGSISTSATGGTGTIQYSINGTTFQSGGTFTGLMANSYTVTAKDANSCIKTTVVPVGNAPAVDGTVTQTAFINCFGQSTAALSIAGAGGTAPYNYLWSNSATTTSISNLPAAPYSVRITDTKGCETTKNFPVTQPAQLSGSLSASDYNGYGVSCPGSTNGSISLTVSGGTAGYTYSWSNGATVKDISSLAAGSYSVEITDSKSCTANTSIIITSPTEVSASIAMKTDVSCNGGSNGSLQVSSSGGTGIYEFSKNGTNWQSSNAFGGFTAGDVTISVRDQNFCSAQVIANISQPSAISVSTFNIQNTTCGQSNGAAEAGATGGTGGYLYDWTNSLSQSIGTTSAVSELSSGSYTITVTDQNLCTGSTIAVINASNGAQFNVGSVTSTKCSNSNDGSAEVSIVSGQGPYVITWSSGESGNISAQLAPGTNTVSVVDGNSCTTIQSFNVPAPASVEIASQTLTAPTCPGTSTAGIEVQITGGTSPYSYSWNDTPGTNSLQNVMPGSYQLHVVDSKSCEFTQSVSITDLTPITISTVSTNAPTCHLSSDGSITVDASGGNGGFTFTWPDLTTGTQHTGLSAGEYSVSVKDSQNCGSSSTIALAAPEPVSVSIASDEPSCNGEDDGALTATGDGGTGSYSFSINGGNTWQTSDTFNDLTAQSYTISMSDANGCVTSSTVELTQPAIIEITKSTTHTTCGLNNGAASATISGGTGAYSYSWANSLNQVVASSASLVDAAPDNYTLTVLDENLCNLISSIVINPSTLSDIQVADIVSTSCVDSTDGQATVQVISGPGPYSYSWSSNETSATATKLKAGSNTVSVTDANNCVTEKSFQIIPPEEISLSSEIVTPPVCPGESTASIQVLATGGAGGFLYSWNDKAGENQLQSVSAGSYSLQVTDSKGCRFSKSISVPDVPVIVIDGTIGLPTCFGGSDGSITASASGGNGTFTYLWANGSTGPIIQSLSAGSYTVVSTDINGCVQNKQFEVVNPEKLVIDVGLDKVICPGQSLSYDANITAASYQWTGPAGFNTTTRLLNSSTPGLYTLKIIDSKGCSAEDSFILSISEKLLKADLIMVSEAHAKDTIIIIDISWPVPDQVSWDFDSKYKIIESTKDYALIRYEEPGVYTVTLNASLAGCQSSYIQKVTILEERESEGGRKSDEGFAFLNYSVHPNPFRESFELNAELTSAATLIVQLISVGTNKIILKDELQENRIHQKSYATSNLIPGIYVLVIRSRDQIKSVRLIKL